MSAGTTPAWACAPGILSLPFRQALLPDLALRALPGPDVRAVVGWGLKGSTAVGRWTARARHLPYVAIEDGFLRSVGLGETGAVSQSLIVDDLGIYYDATRPSALERLIETAPDWCDAAMQSRSRALIDRIVTAGLSRTNLGQPVDTARLEMRRRVLIVDQTAGDASLRLGLAGPNAFAAMVAAARMDEPDAQLIVKRHPAVAAGVKRGCIDDADLTGLTVMDDVAAADLLRHVHAVYVVTSGLGFEALLRDIPVRCFGAPFYSGWGLTRDRVQTGRRGLNRSLEAVAAAALIRYSRYVDPITGHPCQAEDAVDRLASLTRRARRLAGSYAAVDFTPAKRAAVGRLMNSPLGHLEFHGSASAAVAEVRAKGGRLLCWGGQERPETIAAAAEAGLPLWRMEDGFLRSRGLGSDFIPALSVTLDATGAHYDGTCPSELETWLQTRDFPPELLQRARNLRQAIVESGLSKYNLAGPAAPIWNTDRRRILIVGQVENDRSILLGCENIRTNAGLVAAVRAAHPEAFLIYRDHPDVRAGNRPGALPAEASDLLDARADDLGIAACIDAADAIATLTSLTGFEALLRGKPVLTWGRPFYAGWGLTEDALPCPRRTRRLTLDQLVAASLIEYPLYVTQDGWPCEVEDLIRSLGDTPERPGPARGPVRRWLRALTASLDRSLPPAY